MRTIRISLIFAVLALCAMPSIAESVLPLPDDVKALMPYEQFPTVDQMMALIPEDDPHARIKRADVLLTMISIINQFPVIEPGKWDDLEKTYKRAYMQGDFPTMIREDDRALLDAQDFSAYRLVMSSFFPEAYELRPYPDNSYYGELFVKIVKMIVVGLVALLLLLLILRLLSRIGARKDKIRTVTSRLTISGVVMIISGLALFVYMVLHEEDYVYFAEIAAGGLFGLAPLGVIFVAAGLIRSASRKRSQTIEAAKAYNRAGRTIFNGKTIPFGKAVKTEDEDGNPIPYPYMVTSERQPIRFLNPLPIYTLCLAAYLVLAYYCWIYPNAFTVPIVLIGVPVVLVLYYFFAIKPFNETRGMKEIEPWLDSSQEAFYRDIGGIIYSIQGGTMEDAVNAAQLCTIEQREALIDRSFEALNRSFHVRLHVKVEHTPFKFWFYIVRGLRLMPPLDRELLRAVLHLYNTGHIDSKAYEYYAGATLAGDRQASIERYKEKISNNDYYEHYMPLSQLKTGTARAFWLLENVLGWRHDEVQSDVLHLVDRKLNDFPQDRTIRKVHDMIHQGGKWLTATDIPGSIYENTGKNPYVLSLGTLEDGTPLTFSKDGSLITIGGAGTGKTQCLVIPNLLSWQGAAIVLDIKPELYDFTAGYRQQNFGKVYKLDFTSDTSQQFNPFDYIRNDPNEIFGDSQFFANLIMPPSVDPGGNHKFWEESARNIIQAFLIAKVAERSDDQKQDGAAGSPSLTMAELIRQIVDREELEQTLYILSSHPSELCSLLGRRIQSNLILPEKNGSNVLSNVLTQLWTQMQPLLSQRISNISKRCDWTPEGLRRENATLYITMTPAQVVEFAPLLRLILGVHLREYLALSDEASKQLPPILLMFDEMPQLGYMQAIEQAVDVGRSKGIKLWGFIQRLGQLESQYADARGLLGNCKAQLYLSPSTKDGAAQMVSEALGTRQDLATGQQTPLAAPAALSGAEYSDKIVITGQGTHPAKVSRDWAYQDPELERRIGMPQPITNR